MLLRKLLMSLTGAFVLFGVISSTPAATPNKAETERALFIRAETAFTKGRMTEYLALKKKLNHYPLYPYLLYREFEQNMSSLNHQSLLGFIENYHDSPLSEQLRTKWLQTKAKQENWKDFLKGYTPTEDLSLQCQAIWAELQTLPDPKTTLAKIQPIWIKGKQIPKSCEAPFALWEKSGLMTHPMAWQRVRAAIQEGNEAIARKTAKYLKKSEFALVELWLMIRKNPFLVTHKKYFKEDHPAYLEMLVDGVSLIAKSKPDTAITIWKQISHQYPFRERHWGLVVRSIGLTYAFQKHKDAEKWLNKVPAIHTDKAVHEWRIRIALHNGDWHGVLRNTRQLPETLANAEEWLYWHSRALEMVNQSKESQEILNKLAKSRSYYGFLASQQLFKPVSLLHNKMNVDKEMLQKISKNKAVRRAHELYCLGRYEKARSEWQFSTQKMNETDKHAAANLALQWNLPNWSIIALAKADNKNDLSLRFPMVYGQHIISEAKRNTLDPAWILAVTRQESAFVPHAKSSAGALGLMQLMPSTAKMVAKKRQVQLGTSGLLRPETNIQLGSTYLRMMLDEHKNHHVLATAAYNAGSSRVRKWLPSYDMAADIWIETIPFKETREYVKNVMAYTVIYQELMGKKPNLNRQMPYVPAGK